MKRFLIVLGLAIGIGVVIAVAPGHRGWFDIGVYHGAVDYWVSGGDLYSYLRPRSTYGFTYPPFAAVCMLPMTLVGWHPAIAINLVLTLIASAFLLWFWVGPVTRHFAWPRWYAFGLAACAFAALNPVRDTVSFGQINLLLVALVYLDLLLLTGFRPTGFRLTGFRRPGRPSLLRWIRDMHAILGRFGMRNRDLPVKNRASRIAGVGIGLAAAIKLTPAIFVLYLVVTRQWRAAATAIGTATAATLITALAVPDASRAYFTDAVWNTSRIGNLAYVSNQSLLGLVSRLHLAHAVWLLLVVATLAVWAWRCARAKDHVHGFALTGVVSCLISPITWVHHLVWALPALVLFLYGRRRLGIACFVVLVSGTVWLWSVNPSFAGPLAVLGANAYVLVTLVLLVAAPVPAPSPDSPDASAPAPPRPQRPPALPAAPPAPAAPTATRAPRDSRVGAADR
ncbi:glycosyltransferase 87 family protein [Hamadaea sp. NPDC051192]|uniref:glycosyltransferase 87 family protein n=1 Tax=Hamadaea sp. NPDC051192 TaxID=3154940 RepID=UPI00342285C4